MPIPRDSFEGISNYEASSPARVAIAINRLNAGKFNGVLDVTIIEASGQPQDIFDDRISDQSFISIMHTAVTPTFYISFTGPGQAKIGWTGAGWGTADLRLLIVG